MSKEIEENVAAILAREGVKYDAVFVPQSLSRNSAEKARTINWCVTFTRGKESMAFDYMSGSGNIPGYVHGRTSAHTAANYEASEKGVYAKPGQFQRPKRVPAPAAVGVVYSLVMVDDTHGAAFEDWALELGYDTDSRKAEEVFRACEKQTRDNVRVFGRALLEELATALQDY